ncbi:hypothetical protein ACHZ98_28765 [Streptomyces sp. MAR4 CNY-716]
MLRRILALPVAIAAALAVSAPSTNAAQSGAGEWDYKGVFPFVAKGTGAFPYETHAVYSGGGNLKVCIKTSTTADHYYLLTEWDPGTNIDEHVATRGSGCWEAIGLDRFVDGDNNRAEFYVATSDSAAVSAQYWD